MKTTKEERENIKKNLRAIIIGFKAEKGLKIFDDFISDIKELEEMLESLQRANKVTGKDLQNKIKKLERYENAHKMIIKYGIEDGIDAVIVRSKEALEVLDENN